MDTNSSSIQLVNGYASHSKAVALSGIIQESIDMQLASFSHGYGQLAYHIVLVTKYRRKMFGAELLAKRVDTTLREIANRYKMQIHALKVLEDHVHIFINFKPSMSLSAVFQYLKGISSYEIFKDFPWLKAKFRTGHMWSRGKFFRTVGSVTAEAIEHYINESQKKHLFY
jgi:putative transposase